MPKTAQGEDMPDGTVADYKSLVTNETYPVRLLQITADKKMIITDLDGTNRRAVSAWKIKNIHKEKIDGKTS